MRKKTADNSLLQREYKLAGGKMEGHLDFTAWL